MTLTREMVKTGLSNLGNTTDGSSMVYVDCTLKDLNLEDVGLLQEYRHLLHVNVSGNLLADLRVLDPLTSLRKLRAANNRIRDAAHACPKLFALQELDLAKNLIPKMTDFADHTYLRKLNLDGNEIEAIEGLSGLENLIELSINDNRLTAVGGLGGLHIRRLSLQGNEIHDASGVAALAHTLEDLSLASNEISLLVGIDQLTRLVKLDVGGNKIAQMVEVERLSKLVHLRQLTIAENPVVSQQDEFADIASDVHSDIVMPDHNHDVEEPDALATTPVGDDPCTFPPPGELPREVMDRYKLLYALQQLTVLDGEEVTAKDKRKAVNALGHEQQGVDVGAMGLSS